MSFLKILVIGDVATGKTSLVNRIVSNAFNENYKPTIGCEFGFKLMEVNGETVRVQLWDLAGQDRLGGMSRLYCRDAHGALIISDLTRSETIEKSSKWKSQLEEFVSSSSSVPFPMVICLNKDDMANSETMTAEQLKTFVSEQRYAGGFFTSAKNGHNAEEALAFLVGKVMQKEAAKPETIDPRATCGGGLKLARQTAEKQPMKAKKGCC